MKVMIAECLKGKRRFGFLMSVALAAIAILWCSMGKIDSDMLGREYDVYLYQMTLVHSLLMPVGMATLATRAWDMEYQSASLKLLFTLQSRSGLYAMKALFGLAQILLISVLEAFGVTLLCHVDGVTQAYPLRNMLLFGLSTFAVNAMIFFASLCLSIKKESLALSLGAGAAMSMLGVFSAFMPPKAAALMPWGYYAQLVTVRMEYDSATRISTFLPVPYDAAKLLVCVILALMFAALAWRMFREKEV